MIKYSLKNTHLTDRVAFISRMCKDKNVLHYGATASPKTENSILKNTLLHSKLAQVAKSIVGVDIDRDMIEVAKKNGINDIIYGDMEKFNDFPSGAYQVIVAGEIFEHLDNPGLALDSIGSNIDDSTDVIITVPNAYSIKGLFRALFGFEYIHPDHILFHSQYTLTNLVRRHGFEVSSVFSYVNGGSGFAFRVTKIFLHFFHIYLTELE